MSKIIKLIPVLASEALHFLTVLDHLFGPHSRASAEDYFEKEYVCVFLIGLKMKAKIV